MSIVSREGRARARRALFVLAGAAFVCARLLAATPAPAETPVPATVPRDTRAGPGRSSAPNARLYLTWHAPFGQPGATDQLMAACGDTTVKDTLYLCFDPGSDIERFQSFTATLYFWAAGEDSLDAHWRFGEGQSYTRLKAQYTPAIPGVEPAWPASAFAFSGYNSSRGSGKFRMVAAGPSGQGWPLQGGKTYVAARLLVPRPADPRSCDHPVCIEWALALFGLGNGALPEVKSGQRFVSWNSRGGKVCAPMREFAAPPPWQPKLAPPPGWKR